MTVSSFTVEQNNVAAHRQGHALVSAVAGSGKTEVLVERTVQMLNEGIPADRMLILMFNKSAQEVFKQRLLARVGDDIPEILTFHALGLRILEIWYDRKHAVTPELLDTDEVWMECLKDAISDINQEKSAGISDHPDQLRKYLAAIDVLKNMDYPECSVDWKMLGWRDNFVEQVQLIFPLFESYRKKSFSLGLNDLLYDAVALLRREKEYALEWAHSIDHIMVDEYQDSNALQHWILDTLLTEQSSLMVVGDEDQCIYTWRAADPNMMVRGFEAKYKNVQRYMLSRTFRYGHAIALMANRVLQYNQERPDKLVVSGTGNCGDIVIQRYDNTLDIPNALRQLTQQDVVLVREFRHMDDIELIARKYNIPYVLEGAPLFPSRATGLALNTCLGCILNESYHPSVEEAKAWIRWVDPNTSGLFADYLSQDMATLGIEAAIRKSMVRTTMTETQQKHLVQMLVFNGRLRDLYTQPDQIRSLQERMQATWCRVLERDVPAVPVMVKALEHFYDMTIPELHAFLSSWAIHEHGVLLTSIHRAKGGGWPTVYLPHLEQGQFPNEVSEEERRLFYVAITRAKQKLIVRAPTDRLRDAWWKDSNFAIAEDYKGPTGRFLLESNPELSLARAQEWVSNNKPTTSILNSIERRYEKELFPNVLKSSSLWDALI